MQSESLSSRYDAFLFEGYEFDPDTRCLSLKHSYSDGPAFVERVTFPGSPRMLDEPERVALDRVFRLVFLLAGVSY